VFQALPRQTAAFETVEQAVETNLERSLRHTLSKQPSALTSPAHRPHTQRGSGPQRHYRWFCKTTPTGIRQSCPMMTPLDVQYQVPRDLSGQIREKRLRLRSSLVHRGEHPRTIGEIISRDHRRSSTFGDGERSGLEIGVARRGCQPRRPDRAVRVPHVVGNHVTW